ncbi:MAG: type II secretion system F family protein [Candidatus Omnitrophica bacterium]|nr:type II secretion system F family protein [Candidatus Omnitrophota bacterium]MBU1128783.1 type II secretion system F family protein [Candidatus Omnitrophota bacterium]MBU1656745.1 type II secretion system F family protein [Candidatus Omnitrophota bacterium]MBU1785216.1 type II secretion system F family protein [Candidatus Omnitrophota bacterium]MBU1851224.1 type II secretion system F family protein [Candidatus Omnitrophota bacterium]
MAKFNYTVKDIAGRTVKGNVSAADKKQALDLLREKKFVILKLEEAARGRSLSVFTKKKKVKLDDLVIFFRQLATMIDSGIPVVMSLDILIDQSENSTMESVLTEVRDSVNTGSSLSDAMAGHSEIFSALFVNMVRAGESSGTLDVILDRVATYIEKTNALQKKIKSALIYPAVVSGMAVVITLVLILKVIPVFKDIFSGFGAKLPAPTEFLINLSDFMRAYFFLIVIFIAAIVVVIKWYLKTPRGRLIADSFKLKAPIFGDMMKKVAISKFSRTLSTLVKSGVPILASLEIVAKTAGNVAIERAINDVKDSVRDGESIAAPLERSDIFPSMVTRMIAVGEKTGQLEKMLAKISDFYDTQVDTSVDGLTSLIEPLIIAFLGIVIGSVVLCMFLPIFKMSDIVNF